MQSIGQHEAAAACAQADTPWSKVWHQATDQKNPFCPATEEECHSPYTVIAFEVAWADMQVQCGARKHSEKRSVGQVRNSVTGLLLTRPCLLPQGMDYTFPLHQDGRLVIEAKKIVKRTFRTVRRGVAQHSILSLPFVCA